MPFVLARTVRSGVVEAVHEGWAAVADTSGRLIETFGPFDGPILYRSAIKPIQAYVSQDNGADLVPEQMALACSSHDAFPVHLGIVTEMLSGAGLTQDALGCPAAPADAPASRLDMARRGRPDRMPLHHACSGKHAAFLRACVASGWPVDSYLDPAHPLQRRVLAEVAEATGVEPGVIAVDGCGAPAPSGTVRGLATAFARLTVDPRYRAQYSAMTTYPALLTSNARPEAVLGAWWTGAVKRGAGGVIAAGRRGIGIAVKSKEGSSRIAAIGLIALLTRMGMLPDAALAALEPLASPPNLGGGRPVGAVVPVLGA